MTKLLITLYVLATSLGLIILKLGSTEGAPISIIENRVQLNINSYSVIGIMLYGVSFLLYMYLISKFELGYIIPLTTAFIYIVIFLASFLLFNETFTAAKILGIVLIVSGLTFLNLKS